MNPTILPLAGGEDLLMKGAWIIDTIIIALIVFGPLMLIWFTIPHLRRGWHATAKKVADYTPMVTGGTPPTSRVLTTPMGYPGTPLFVAQHRIGECPPGSPRHPQDNLCTYCTWAHADGQDGPWGVGSTRYGNTDHLDAYLERLADITGLPYLDGTMAGAGVPRVLPGHTQWPAESAWLHHLEASGVKVYWPTHDIWGQPLPEDLIGA